MICVTIRQLVFLFIAMLTYITRFAVLFLAVFLQSCAIQDHAQHVKQYQYTRRYLADLSDEQVADLKKICGYADINTDNIHTQEGMYKFVQDTQEKFVARDGGKERYEVDRSKLEWIHSNKNNIQQCLQNIGMIDAINQKQKEYDAICILDAIGNAIKNRISYASHILKNVKTKYIILLTGERYLKKDIDCDENTLEQLSKINKISKSKLTERHLFEYLFNNASIKGDRELIIVDTKQCNGKRPTTQTTIRDLMKKLINNKALRIRSILFVSNQPFVKYQEVVIRSELRQYGNPIRCEFVGDKHTGSDLARVVGVLGSYIWAANNSCSEQSEYGKPEYLSNMLFHRFVRKGVTGKKLKNPRIVLKAKNYNIKEYDWYKYMPDIQEQIKKIKLKNVTDKNYLDEYLRINKEFKKRVFVSRGFIDSCSQPMMDMNYFHRDIAASEYDLEMSLDAKDRNEERIAKLKEYIDNFNEMFYYGSHYRYVREIYSYKDLSHICDKLKNKIIELYGRDRVSATRLYYKIIEAVMSRTVNSCGGGSIYDEEAKYDGIVNKDMTRRRMLSILRTISTNFWDDSKKEVELDSLLTHIEEGKRNDVKNGIIEAATDCVNEIANFTEKYDANIADDFKALQDNELKIPSEKWKDEKTGCVYYGYEETVEEKIRSKVRDVFLDTMFVLDIAYDDVDEYARKEGEPDVKLAQNVNE